MREIYLLIRFIKFLFASPAGDAGGVSQFGVGEVYSVGVLLAWLPLGVELACADSVLDPAAVADAHEEGDIDFGLAVLRDGQVLATDVLGCVVDRDAAALAGVIDCYGAVGAVDRPPEVACDVIVACESESGQLGLDRLDFDVVGKGVLHTEVHTREDVLEMEGMDTGCTFGIGRFLGYEDFDLVVRSIEIVEDETMSGLVDRIEVRRVVGGEHELAVGPLLGRFPSVRAVCDSLARKDRGAVFRCSPHIECAVFRERNRFHDSSCVMADHRIESDGLCVSLHVTDTSGQKKGT